VHGLLVTLVMAGAGAAPALAQTQADEAVWTALSMRGPLTATGSWRWSADTLARSRNGVNTLDILFEALWLTHDVNDRVTVGVAYAFGAGFLDTRTLFEHRGAQQVSWSRGRRPRVSVRSLIEERFISGRNSALLRAREQVKVVWPIAARGRINGLVSEEILVQADTRRLSDPVLDGNRLFVGVGGRLTPRHAVEVGYFNVLARAGAQGYRRSHVLSLSVATTVSRMRP
jgi:hypothetical protein